MIPKNIKFESCCIEVEYLSENVLSQINIQRVTTGFKSRRDAVHSLLTNHGKERLSLAGERGWEIRALNRVVTDIGFSDHYYMQRSSEHERFGNDFRNEYLDSQLKEKQDSEVDRILIPNA